MDKGKDIESHINMFNICIFKLLSVNVKIDDEGQAIIVLYSLPKTYHTLATTLLVGKTTLIVNKVSITLFTTSNVIKPIVSVHEDVLATRVDSRTSSSSRGKRKHRRRDSSEYGNYFMSRLRDDIEFFYYHKKSTSRGFCEGRLKKYKRY